MFDKELYEKYKSYRQELNNLFYTEKQYEECLQNTKDFEQLLKNDGIIDKYNHQFLNMMYAKIYNHLGNIADSIKHANKALKFSSNKDEEMYANWALRNAYAKIDIQKAKYYNELCEDYYKEIGDMFSYADMLGEKGTLMNEEQYTNEAINIVIGLDTKEFTSRQNSKENVLDELYQNLFYIYENGHDELKRSKMSDILHNINNPELKLKLSKQMFRLIV